MFIPIYLVIVNSLKTDIDARSMGIGPPDSPQFGNFEVVIEEGKLSHAFFNSVLYTVFSDGALRVVATAAAAVLARNRTRRNRLIYLFLVIGIAMPINYVTLTKVMQETHLINTQLGIILVYAAFKLPFAVS